MKVLRERERRSAAAMLLAQVVRGVYGRGAGRQGAAVMSSNYDFMTLLSDGKRLTGAYALGPEAGEWLQQATLAIRARVPLEVMRDTIQPFPTFSEVFLHALTELGAKVPAAA